MSLMSQGNISVPGKQLYNGRVYFPQYWPFGWETGCTRLHHVLLKPPGPFLYTYPHSYLLHRLCKLQTLEQSRICWESGASLPSHYRDLRLLKVTFFSSLPHYPLQSQSRSCWAVCRISSIFFESSQASGFLCPLRTLPLLFFPIWEATICIDFSFQLSFLSELSTYTSSSQGLWRLT